MSGKHHQHHQRQQLQLGLIFLHDLALTSPFIMAPTYAQDLLELQKTTTDYFDLWRAGDVQAIDYQAENRKVIIKHLHFPRPSKFQGHKTKKHKYGIRPAPKRFEKHRRKHFAGDHQLLPWAEQAVNILEEKLKMSDLVVTKILGWG